MVLTHDEGGAAADGARLGIIEKDFLLAPSASAGMSRAAHVLPFNDHASPGSPEDRPPLFPSVDFSEDGRAAYDAPSARQRRGCHRPRRPVGRTRALQRPFAYHTPSADS